MDERWTLEELVQRAARALVAADVRVANGRVTEVPDARLIRWYATIGLVDRPVMRGRVAHYGERHLLQLVAVKRLQAQGLPLAEIQHRLAGATDATLRDRRAARPTHPAQTAGRCGTRPSRQRDVPRRPPAARHDPAARPPADGPAGRRRPRFWASRAPAATR